EGAATIAHACDRTPARHLPPGPAHPWPVEPLRLDPSRPRRARQDPAAGRRGAVEHRDRQPGRLLTPNRHPVATPLHPGRPGRAGGQASHGRADTLAATLTPPPEHLGVTHWSTRLLGDELGVSHNTVARVWRDHDLKPWRTETFTFSTDPQLEAKIGDVVGLYLHPPERAIVVWVDEKSQI